MALPLNSFGPAELYRIYKGAEAGSGALALGQYSYVDADINRTTISEQINVNGTLYGTPAAPVTTELQSKVLEELVRQGGKVRNLVIEIGAGAQSQCGAIFGTHRPMPTDCWLCGFPLNIPLASGAIDPRSAPECEHIIPASAALLFYGIIDNVQSVSARGTAGGEGAKEDKGDIEFYVYNYDLAHSECNSSKKSDKLFINIIDSNYNIITPLSVNPEFVNNFSNNLLTPLGMGRNSLVFDLLTHVYAREAAATGITFEAYKMQWIQHNNTKIASKVKPLVDFINGGGGSPISLLLGVAKLVENIDYIFAKAVGVKYPYPSGRNADGSVRYENRLVNSKKSYQDFIDLAKAKITGVIVRPLASARPFGAGRTHKKRNRKSKTYKRKNGRNPRTSQALAKYHPR